MNLPVENGGINVAVSRGGALFLPMEQIAFSSPERQSVSCSLAFLLLRVYETDFLTLNPTPERAWAVNSQCLHSLCVDGAGHLEGDTRGKVS